MMPTQLANERPRLLVLSSLFPSAMQPGAGLFIRERMFRVAKYLPIVVVAPQAWFPLQRLIRRFRPHFRPPAASYEVMNGIEVYRPRVLSVPGVLKRFDGIFMALGSLLTVRALARKYDIDLLDVHFGYPDGTAGRWLARWLDLPMVLTLRGKEERQARTSVGPALRAAIRAADHVICVSEALRKVAIDCGVPYKRVTVIGNGVDLDKFAPVETAQARAALGLPDEAKVLVSIGTLVERKGFHVVIDALPALLVLHPTLRYVIVGGAGPEGDLSAQLHRQVDRLNLRGHVHFLGALPPDSLHVPLSAANVFVLATSYEGWANVFLEAMACGLPVVTTRVGGNAQVVNDPALGTLVAVGDIPALTAAIDAALTRAWDHGRIIGYARANSWDQRIPLLVEMFDTLYRESAPTNAAPHA